MQGTGYRVQGIGYRVQGIGYRVQGCRGAGYRCYGWDLGFVVQGPGFGVLDLECDV